MNKKTKVKGLIRNQTCDNCDLYRYSVKKRAEYCDSSMLLAALPEERTCPRWLKRSMDEATQGPA
jgi:hypothetical protein